MEKIFKFYIAQYRSNYYKTKYITCSHIDLYIICNKPYGVLEISVRFYLHSHLFIQYSYAWD